ncbi:50S ribosomal protein L2 [Chitinivibrio alkaliphilus]|uniref:Large ribosomal subunit protein uL2 n=1 Tax=Chitinivibrio alkaliphilus ACht1 TaxID=1313304 RepID=U7D885_9BACT|nr:50S ribosomal protein L2 [Chitinivibrio alkaliphilus]ERP31292.1 50S ribosomal protein L2 [Chitinivibrio alkaliphilus ACht1]
MAIKSFKPKSPTLRYKRILDKSELCKDAPWKSLTAPKKSTAGRNDSGRITSRFRGGGHKQKYRIVDFKGNKHGVPGVVERIEYDPNRTANIALVKYADGERRYTLATLNMYVGMEIIAGENVEPKEGNRLPLGKIYPGYDVCNVEMREGNGGKMVRSAGTFATVVAKDGDKVQLRLPSGEIRAFRETLYATVGQVSNVDHMNEVGGSAGRSRWKGRKPHVRGVVMNPVDHPMGGGEGKTSGGGHPVSPWGKKAKGQKTRKRGKASDKYIVKKRK